MKKNIIIILCIVTNFIFQSTYTNAPLGLFVPYDMNIKLKRPAQNHFYFGILGEHSYTVKGYDNNECAEISTKTDPLQIYEPAQNLLALYQGLNTTEQSTPPSFTQLIDSIAAGPGGGVSNYQNGLFKPTGKFSAGQIALSSMYGIGHGVYVSAHLPIYFVKLDCVNWEYAGNNNLFSGEKIQQELVDSFVQDAQDIFHLNVTGWKKHGPGDLTFLLEWQQDFAQRRPILKSVQPNIRLGLSVPTGVKADENVIMPTPFGADGSVSIPFGGGLGINLANRAELGFNGQFWYMWSNEKCRRIKTFPTQTSLLYPVAENAIREYSFTQNFNLYTQVYSFCKRFTFKMCYQYWRQGDDVLTPASPNLSYDIANTDLRLAERTRHNVILALTYSPRHDDFQRVIPQAQIFWKGGVKGSRAAIASTAGAQLALIF